MARYRDVAEVHGALLPRYEAADRELAAARALERARGAHGAPPSPRAAARRRASRLEAEARRDELERRLLLAFREVEAVEEAMVALCKGLCRLGQQGVGVEELALADNALGHAIRPDGQPDSRGVEAISTATQEQGPPNDRTWTMVQPVTRRL